MFTFVTALKKMKDRARFGLKWGGGSPEWSLIPNLYSNSVMNRGGVVKTSDCVLRRFQPKILHSISSHKSVA